MRPSVAAWASWPTPSGTWPTTSCSTPRPYRAGEPYHWHAHIWPKATTTAGFELGTGVAINVVSPEEAADTLKVSALAR